MNSTQNIGLYGGSFDPVHLGHLLVAQAAFEEAGLNRLFFIPAALSPFKPGARMTPAAERLRLLRLALAGKTHYEIDPQETLRGGVSYSIDTVRDYARRFYGAKLFYIIGADNVATLGQWRNASELAAAVEFLVVARPGQPDVAFPAGVRGRRLNGFPFGVSSSEIRARVKAGQTVEHLAPPGVAEAIRNYRLYL